MIPAGVSILVHTCLAPEVDGAPKPPCAACIDGLAKSDVDVQAVDASLLHELGVSVRLWNGWRCAYRMQEPEKETPEKVADRIANRQLLSVDRPWSTECSRTKSVAQRKELAESLARIGAARAASQKAAWGRCMVKFDYRLFFLSFRLLLAEWHGAHSWGVDLPEMLK